MKLLDGGHVGGQGVGGEHREVGELARLQGPALVFLEADVGPFLSGSAEGLRKGDLLALAHHAVL